MWTRKKKTAQVGASVLTWAVMKKARSVRDTAGLQFLLLTNSMWSLVRVEQFFCEKGSLCLRHLQHLQGAVAWKRTKRWGSAHTLTAQD